jgi:hypothetical protein
MSYRKLSKRGVTDVDPLLGLRRNPEPKSDKSFHSTTTALSSEPFELARAMQSQTRMCMKLQVQQMLKDGRGSMALLESIRPTC